MENRNSNNNNRRDEEECNWFTVSLTKYHLMNSNNHYSNKSTSSTNQDDLFDKLGRQFTELATDAMQSNTNYQLVKSNPIHELYVNKTSTIQTVAKTQLLSSPYSSCTPLSSVTTSLLNPDVLITDCRQKRPTNLASETVKSVERIKKERKSIREKYSGMDSGKDQEFKVKELANTTTRTIKTVTNASVDANSITHNLSTNCYPTQVVHPIVNRDERKKSSSSPLSSSSSTSTSASSSSSCTPTVTRKFTQKYKTMKTVDSEKVDSKILSIGLNEHLRRRDEQLCINQKQSTLPLSPPPAPSPSPSGQYTSYRSEITPETSRDQMKQNKQESFNNTDKLNTKLNDIGFYRILNTIGSGNFSQVKLATHILTQERVAIKVIDKSKMDSVTRRLLSREISILESLHHPNIIRLYEVIETMTRLNLVMEYVAGGDLNRRIVKFGKLTEHEGRIVFAQLIAAVNHLHERNIIHRDIKAENILFAYNFQNLCQTSMNIKKQCGKLNKENLKNRNYFGDKLQKLLRYRSYSNKSRIYDFSNKDDTFQSAQTENNNELKRQNYNQQNISNYPYDNKLIRDDFKQAYNNINCNSLKLHSNESMKKNKSDNYEHFDDDLNINGLCPDHYRVKLVDFGFSKLIKDPNQQLTTFCGSPAYAAPELFQSQSYRGGPVDMWALGIVLFFMLTGLLPFRGSTVGQVRRLVLDNCGLQPPDSLSPAAADLYRNLTARSPDMRPTASQLIKYAQYARKDLSTIEISLRQRSTWTSWLAGQTFPKPLPRFKHCPPLPSTLRAQQKSSPPRPSTSSESKSASNQIDQKLSVHQNSSSTTNHQMLNSTETLTSSLVNNQSVNTTNHNQNKSVVCENNRKLRKKLSKCQTITKDSLDNDEVEAANLLLNLGITPEEIQSSHNYESRSAVTGAYRIMLHKIHRSRRLSRLDQVINTLGNNENYNPTKFTATLPTIKSSTSITTRQNIHETPVDTSTVNVADNQNTEKTKDQVKFHTLPRLKQISQPSVKQSNPSSFDQSKKKLHQKSQEKSQSKLCHLI